MLYQSFRFVHDPFSPLREASRYWIVVGKLPVSFPRSVGTTPVFYNYLKGSRPVDPGQILDDGTLVFGHQVSSS